MGEAVIVCRSCQAGRSARHRNATSPRSPHLQCDPGGRQDVSVDRREETAVAGVESRDFDSPDETRKPDKTQVDVVRMGSTTAARLTFEPGWRWSECIKPVVGTDSCQVRHVGIVQSGRMSVKHDDGTELEIGAGDAYVIEPGHDAWVVGDEGFVGFEFESRSAEEYAKG
jgi:mannose-6-phosphate isomerase-like protein (cupin superfamily)